MIRTSDNYYISQTGIIAEILFFCGIFMTRSLHTKEYKAFVDLIIKTRKVRGLTQQTVADRLSKHQSYVAKIERGERRVDIVEFKNLAEAMGCDPRKMFNEWGE